MGLGIYSSPGFFFSKGFQDVREASSIRNFTKRGSVPARYKYVILLIHLRNSFLVM